MAAPTPVKQVIENGNRNYLATVSILFTSAALDPVADYVLADPTASGDMGVVIAGNTLYPGTSLKIWRLDYDISPALGVNIEWDATTDQTALIVNGEGSGKRNFTQMGGLPVPLSGGAPITGATGKLLLNSLGTPADGLFISINMWLKKDISR